MGPAVLFFLVLAVAPPLVLAAKTHNSTSTWGYNSTAKPSTVWINNYETECVLFRELRADYDFEFGTSAWFFCSNFNTSPCNEFLFGVFFGDRLVWSANRDHPVRENATLEFTSDGNLVLRDADGSQVWSSNSSGRSVAGMVITEIGNLVLFDQRNATVWQSSDHPTDTLLPGQSLLEGKRLTASTSPTNTTKGQFYITVHQDGLYAYVESTPPQLYFEYMTNLAKIGNDPVKVTFTNGSLNIVVRPDINDSIPLLPEAKSAQVMSMDSDGHLRLYELSGTKWTSVYDVMNIDDCDYPTVCGEYGICTEGQCTCPLQKNSISSYFKLVDEWKPNLGCAPIIPISCQETQHHKLLTLPHISYFAQSHMVWNATSIDDCKQLCLKNCSCMAVLVRYEVCEWITKVFSLQSKQPDTVGYSVYLKVQVSPSNKNKKKVMLGATIGTITALVLLVIVVALYLQKRRKYEEKDEFYFDQFPGMPTRFSFEKLSECTEGFIKKLGEGGFGSVFEGKLGEERVAVKRLEGARQGKKEFLAEVETIGSIEHINLVSLIGFCAEKTERLLVYEYMSRGSLDRWIYYHHNNGPLDWCTRSRIILDIAKGLCYLHEQCKSKIAHLDIKPQNILLDDNFNAKVADFGLCKLINRDQSKVVTVMRGTPGYLAPEWLTSRITEKVDVYSFGVVLMEIVSGRKNIDHARPEEEVQLINVLREKAQNDQLVDLIDKHSDDMVSHQEEVIEMMKLAIWCLQNDSIQRPSMSVVIKVLEGSMSVETIDANSVMPVQHNASTCSVPPQASVLSGPR